MPGGIRKRKGGYQVRWGGKVTARKTSKGNAQKQLNLLRGLKHGWKPSKRR